MTLKIRLILACVVFLFIVTAVICSFLYIKHLNEKITDLNVTVAEQKDQIDSLHGQISTLELNIAALHDTISITNSYIESIEQARIEETKVKSSVLQTVVDDPAAKDWYNTELPASLLDALLESSNRQTD